MRHTNKFKVRFGLIRIVKDRNTYQFHAWPLIEGRVYNATLDTETKTLHVPGRRVTLNAIVRVVA